MDKLRTPLKYKGKQTKWQNFVGVDLYSTFYAFERLAWHRKQAWRIETLSRNLEHN